MTAVPEQAKGCFADASSLLDALDAVRNTRALATVALTLVAFAVALVALGGLSGWLSTKSGAIGGLLFVLSALVWAGILLVGSTAAGTLLSDDVWCRERRTIGSAVVSASFTAHRLAVLILLAGVVLLAYLILLALVLFVCRIPGLGPLLYAIVFPVAAVVTGLLVFFLFYVMLPLAAPCIWSGDSIIQAIATLKEVMRHRPLYVVVMFVLLAILVLVTAGIVGFVIFSGTGLTLSLSLAVIGFGGGFDISSMVMGLGGGGSGGYGVAFGLGMTVLMLLGSVPATLIGMKGAVIIHKAAISGLALDDAAAEIQHHMDEVKRRAQEARGRVLAPNPVPATRPLVCPNAQCAAPIGADEAFCTECGEKLK